MSESSGLPPEQDAVRRLLADARHDGPPPPDVVARLDETLASLVAERSAELTAEDTAGAATGHDDRSPGRVVDLGSRRRRVASIGLLAAASVVVAGVALGQALPRGSNDTADSAAGGQSDTSLAESPRSEDDDGAGASAEAGGDASSESELLEPDPKEELPAARTRGTSHAVLRRRRGHRRPAARAPTGRHGRRQRLRSLAAIRGCDSRRPGSFDRRGVSTGRRSELGWSCSDAPPVRPRTSSSTCAVRPIRCVRSRCPRPERCGRGVEQRSPTIG